MECRLCLSIRDTRRRKTIDSEKILVGKQCKCSYWLHNSCYTKWENYLYNNNSKVRCLGCNGEVFVKKNIKIVNLQLLLLLNRLLHKMYDRNIIKFCVIVGVLGLLYYYVYTH